MTEVERLRDRIIFSNGIPIENADALIAAVRSELVAYFIERHQSLTAREIKEAIADIQRANVSAATRSDAVVAEGVTAGETALLRRFADAVKALAAKGYRFWDTDEDSKAGKVLSALAGVPGCYPEIDALYAQIGSAAHEHWEPSGKCQLDDCDGTRFDWDSTDSRWGSWFCVKCGGMQVPLEVLETRRK